MRAIGKDYWTNKTGGMIKLYNIKQTPDNKWQITGLKNHTVILDNKHDALKHAEYLNSKQSQLENYILDTVNEVNNNYKIRQLVGRIKRNSQDPYVLGLALEILGILD